MYTKLHRARSTSKTNPVHRTAPCYILIAPPIGVCMAQMARSALLLLAFLASASLAQAQVPTGKGS